MRAAALGLLAAFALAACVDTAAPSNPHASDSSSGAAAASPATSSPTAGGPASSGSSAQPNSSAAPTSGPSPVTGNRPPVPTFLVNRTSGDAPLRVTFTLNATDADGDNLTFTLSFGDGWGNANGALPIPPIAHNYESPGDYTVRVVVSDGRLSANHTLAIHALVPVIVQEMACDILVGLGPDGLPLGIRVLGSGGLAGLGGCVLGTLGQDARLVSGDLKMGACTTKPASVVGKDYAKGTQFEAFCDSTVVEDTVRLSFS